MSETPLRPAVAPGPAGVPGSSRALAEGSDSAVAPGGDSGSGSAADSGCGFGGDSGGSSGFGSVGGAGSGSAGGSGFGSAGDAGSGSAGDSGFGSAGDSGFGFGGGFGLRSGRDRVAVRTGGPVMPAVKRRRARWPWAAAVFALVALGSGAFAVCAGVSNNAGGPVWVAGNSASAAAPDERAVERGEAEAVLDRTGADGAFIVTVTGVRCGLAAVGTAARRVRAARGQFCLVGIAVENAGREARPIDGGAQRVVDVHRRAYAVAGRAAAFLNGRRPSLLEEVPAGATVRGVLPFDVPAGTRLVALLVHESAVSRGARVSLS